MRRVGVVVDADIGPFTAAMGEAAGQTIALRKLMDGLDDRIDINIRVDDRGGLSKAATESRALRSEIDTLSGRVGIGIDLLAILGPALAPIGALAVPAVAGLANQLGFAAAAGGTALLAFRGVGDAIGAMNEYALEPTKENFNEVEAQLSRLSPQAAEFARGIGEMRETFVATRDAAAEGLFPGLTASLDDLDGLLGRVQPVLREIGSATGDMLGDGLASLNSDRWQPFFDFLEREARPTLTDLGSITGDFAHGLSELWMATQPLNSDFSSWLTDVADGFDGWASGLSQTDGFNEFMAYIRDTGPQVADTMSALGGALLDIAVAAAPLGGPVLAGLEAFARVVSAIAESPIGPPLVAAATGMALLNRAMAAGTMLKAGGFFATTAANVQTLTGGLATAEKRAAGFRGAMTGLSRAAGPMAGLALASTDMGDSFALSNTATLALMGSFAGLPGALAGGGIGLLMDAASAGDDITAAFQQAENALKSGSVDDQSKSLENLNSKLEDVGSRGAMWSDFIAPITGDNTFADLEDQADRLRISIERTQNPASGIGGILGQTFGMGTDAINEATQSAEAFHESLLAVNDALTGRSSVRDYEAALDGLTQSIKDNGKTLDINTEAGRANEAALDNIAATSLSVAENLTGMERRQFLVRARKDFIGAARDLGLGEKAARRLANELGLLGKKESKPKVGIDGAPAVDATTRRLRRGFDALPRRLQTRLESQGAPQTMQQITRLQRRYNLTPRQVRTLLQLQSTGALRGITNVNQLLGRTGRTKTNPKVTVDGAGASSTLRGMDNRLRQLNTKKTKPKVDADTNPANQALQQTAGRLGQLNGMRASPNVGADVGGALGGINSVQSALAGLNSKTIYVTTVQRTRRENALGGFWPAETFAFGGVREPGDIPNGHMPVLAGPGPVRVWREPETEGEGYVPLANDYRRPGAKVVTEQIAQHLGGRVEWFADGGHHGPGAVRFHGPAAGRAGGGDLRIVDARVTGRLDVETGQLEGRMRGMVVDEIEGHAAHDANRRRVGGRP